MNRSNHLWFFAILLLGFVLPALARPPVLERYIVVLESRGGSPEAVASELARRNNGQVGYVYSHALQGFSILLPPRAVMAIRNDPRVRYVESDDPVQLFVQPLPTGVDRIFQPDAGDPVTTGSAIDAALSIDGVDDYRVDVDVAVIDTGIDYEHPDLHVVGGTNCLHTSGGGPPWARSYVCVDGPPEGDDDHYHGTHVAGTIGALDNDFGVVGVAPGARLWAVKVLDGSGSGYESGIVAGIDFVAGTTYAPPSRWNSW